MTENEIISYITEYGVKAKKAANILATASAGVKNQVLANAAKLLIENTDKIIAENTIDVENAAANGMSVPMQDRLRLTPDRIKGMAEGLTQLIALDDPIGTIIEGYKRPNGLEIIKKRVPLGVIGIIFEARPNVTADAAGLCIKSGNACILRGGKEALRSNMAVASVFAEALEDAGLPRDCVQLLDNTDREIATAMMRLNKYIDVLIPRGGAGLIRAVVNNASVPVIQTGTGNCHVYIDNEANKEMAVSVIMNAKTQRPSVCNAAETLLVNAEIAESFLPVIAKELATKKVELRCCDKTYTVLSKLFLDTTVIEASHEDWDTEYDDLILAIKVVSDYKEAVEHINNHGTGHSEAIITDNYNKAKYFQENVDAACVYVNASTRFTDGFEFGFGAEIGISNQKLHTRGPMGLMELTTIKYVINGNGQIRQ
ncbi:MAG: glutamate-5-semialdehyde dehydrogenase [Ruminococcaceae bacterium]|nr:glutamate-5-semialdehyde dehydrogenase [Oscillospiraceae bacterium]